MVLETWPLLVVLSLMSYGPGTSCWDSEPPLPQLAASQTHWGNKKRTCVEIAWHIIGTKQAMVSFCVPFLRLAPQFLLFTLMGPIICCNSHTLNLRMVPPDSNQPFPLRLAWVRALAHPHTSDPCKQLFPFSIRSVGQIGSTQIKSCGHCGTWWLTHLFGFFFFSLGERILWVWEFNCLKSTDLDKIKLAPSFSTASQISSPTSRDKYWDMSLSSSRERCYAANI